jgi:hypothetical protein
MTQETNKLTSMVKAAPDQVEGLGRSVDAVQDEMDDIQSEIDAVTDGVCGTTNTDLADYLENVKKPAIAAAAGNPESDYRVTYGGTYGTIVYPTGNISDWAIEHKTIVPPPPPPPILPPTIVWVPVYVYLGVGWDGDTSITTWITDYAFGNDYITRPVTEGATYGLQPNWNLTNGGKSILEANQAKVDASITVLSRYAT